MKKGFYVFIFLILIIPFNVFAATAEFSLDCDKVTAKKGETVTCTVKANVTPEGEEKLASVVGTISMVSGQMTGGTEFNKTGLTLTGTGVTVGTFDGTISSSAAAGDTTISITLTSAKDSNDNDIAVPSTSLTKTIRIKNNDNSISSIKIDGTVASNCILSNTSCSVSEVAKSSVLIAVTTTDSNATVSGAGSKSLACGNNSIKLTIKAEDETPSDYTLNIPRTCNNDTTLKEIVLSVGTLNPTFNASTKSYTVDVASNIDTITIAGTKNNSTQTVTTTANKAKVEYGTNKYTISVKSEKGDTATYTITVNRADDRDTNNLLKNITISDGKLVFDANKTEYEVKVLSTVETIKVTALAESEKAKITITNNEQKLKEGVNPAIMISVKSEKGEEKLYKIVVTKLKEGETLGDNPNLATLKVAGYDLGFNSNQTNYTLKIKKEDKLNISYTVEETGTKVVIAGNDELKDGDVIKITATSVDGTVKEYKIVIEKDNYMLFIIIAGVVGIVAIGGIVFLLIKNKKDKDALKPNDLADSKEEDLLKSMPTADEKMTLNSFGPTTPVSINQGLNEHATNNIFNNYREETPVVLPTNEEKSSNVSLGDTEATRVCSICGHRVSASLKTCPYCKRSF